MSLGSSGFLATVTGLTCVDLQTVLVRLPYVLPAVPRDSPQDLAGIWHEVTAATGSR